MTDIQPVSVTLSMLDRDIVQELAAMHGLTFSAALRMIIREWARNQQPAPQPIETGEQIAA